MRRCLQCHFEWQGSEELSSCPSCSYEYPMIQGFRAYAPELAAENDGFPAEAFDELIKHEDSNFWFRSRNTLIMYFLKKYCPDLQQFLEIGCGTAFVSTGIRKAFPHISITGSEIYINGLDKAANRLAENATLIQMDARNIPYTEEFDVIGSLDVLEHIEDDEKVIAEIFRALKPGGFALIAVPQHMWMWSDVDNQACHVRRYRRYELQEKMINEGFKIVRTTSFVSFLLPLMWLTRKSNNKESGLTIPQWQNATLYAIMQLELLCIKFGLNFPFGGSRFVLGRKEK